MGTCSMSERQSAVNDRYMRAISASEAPIGQYDTHFIPQQPLNPILKSRFYETQKEPLEPESPTFKQLMTRENVSSNNRSTQNTPRAHSDYQTLKSNSPPFERHVSDANSEGTVVRFIEGDVSISNLRPTSKMNPIHQKVLERLELLGDLDPSSISNISDVYDPKIPLEGPFKHVGLRTTYFGQVDHECPHGWGRLVTHRGEVIDGFFERGEISRFSRIISRDGSYYEGGLRNKLKNGRGTFTDKHGISTRSDWVDGKANGKTIITDSSSKVIFSGNVFNGYREGNASYYDKTQKFTYNGNFVRDSFHGLGKKTYENGRVYEGEFYQGKEHGKGELVFVDGRKYVGSFDRGSPHGEGVLMDEMGESKPVFFNHGNRC